MKNPRKLAMEILVDINKNQAYSNLLINKYLDTNMDSRDENFVRELVYGVLENKLYIDHIISKASKIKLKKIHYNILEILRIGVYQIVFMDKIPESAAVNESVKLAKKYGHRGTIGFVNGVLRSIVRNKDKFMTIDVNNKIDYISIKYSHPKYLVERWAKEFGLKFTEELCKANNETPQLNVRVNTLKIDRNSLKEKLKELGFISKEGKYAEDCLIIENPQGIIDTEEFKEGLFTIQDESSMLVAQIMNPKENSLVLDACAAPGGKSTHMAQYMNNKGLILSRDVFGHKINLIKENAKRLDIDIIQADIFDALKKDESLVDKLDYCLLDAPCSGFGLIRRKPEIKWNRKEKDIDSLSDLQYKILDNVKDYIKKGGVLVYSTCTIEKQENILLIERFLRENPNFKLVSIEDRFNNRENLTTLDKGYIQLFPHIHGTDGFFIAKIIKDS